MRIPRLVLFVVAFLLVSAVSNAQTSTPAPRDAGATSLLQKSLTALVGTTTVSDITLNANANWIAGSDNETGTATLKGTAIGQGRMDLSLSGGTRSEVIDASQAAPVGNWCGTDGTWHAMAGHNLMTDPTWFFPALLIGRALSTSSYAISPMDAETQNGIGVEHVQIYQQPNSSDSAAALLQSLSQIDIYLNSSTLLPVSISFNTHPDNDAGTNIPISIMYSNYQTSQGVQLPYHVQKYLNNGLILDLTIQSVQINTGLSSSDFQVP